MDTEFTWYKNNNSLQTTYMLFWNHKRYIILCRLARKDAFVHIYFRAIVTESGATTGRSEVDCSMMVT